MGRKGERETERKRETEREREKENGERERERLIASRVIPDSVYWALCQV
jgi:hypothetical protein